MLLISCYLSWNSTFLKIAGTGRPALKVVQFQYSTLLEGGRVNVSKFKKDVDVFEEVCCNQTGISGAKNYEPAVKQDC